MTANWKPKQTNPDRKWSSDTLIVETRRYIETRRERFNPPLWPEQRSSREGGSQRSGSTPDSTVRAVHRRRTPQFRVGDRASRGGPWVAASCLLGGAAVLVLNVIAEDGSADTIFFLMLLFGLILIWQGFLLLSRLKR